MAGGIERLVAQMLSGQDPDAPHSLLTRLVISAIIVFAQLVLYGFYGVMAGVVVYLLGVELAGVSLRWLYLPMAVALILALRGAARMVSDYWRHHGH